MFLRTEKHVSLGKAVCVKIMIKDKFIVCPSNISSFIANVFCKIHLVFFVNILLQCKPADVVISYHSKLSINAWPQHYTYEIFNQFNCVPKRKKFIFMLVLVGSTKHKRVLFMNECLNIYA